MVGGWVDGGWVVGWMIAWMDEWVNGGMNRLITGVWMDK